MRIAILTAQEPLYLPAFFEEFLQRRGRDVVGVFPCRPVYKGQTTFSMLKRYIRTFGIANAFRLAWRVLGAKLKNFLGGRQGQKRYYSVEAVASHYGIPVETPSDVNAPEFLERLRRNNVDLILSVSCPQIFKEELIKLPCKGCLNIHGADLPEYRGIMPSFWMLANGLTEAAVTIFFVNTGIDTGQVAGKRRFPILPEDTLHSLIVRSKHQACELALEVLDQIESGTVQPTALVAKGSYFSWPTREAYARFRSRGRRLW